MFDKDSKSRTILQQQTTVGMVQYDMQYHITYRTTSSECQYNQQIPHHITKIHVAQLFVVNFLNFSIPSSRSHQSLNYLSMTQRMNGFRQKLEKLLHFQIWLGAKYCDIPYLTIPTHKNLLKYSTVSTCHFIKIRSRRGIGRISYIQLYTSHNTTARIVQKASTANTNRNTSPCCENHVARSFVVCFWNFLFKPSQPYQYRNQQHNAQQKNGI